MAPAPCRSCVFMNVRCALAGERFKVAGSSLFLMVLTSGAHRELYERATALEIEGRSKMSKRELALAIARRQ